MKAVICKGEILIMLVPRWETKSTVQTQTHKHTKELSFEISIVKKSINIYQQFYKWMNSIDFQNDFNLIWWKDLLSQQESGDLCVSFLFF